MIITIDQSSHIPPYEQVRTAIATAIVAGELAPGHRLPTIRQLARDLGIAAGTVTRAYRHLEQAGLIATSGRRGTTVAARIPTTNRPDAGLTSAAREFATVARELGVDAEQAMAVVRSELAR